MRLFPSTWVGLLAARIVLDVLLGWGLHHSPRVAVDVVAQVHLLQVIVEIQVQLEHKDENTRSVEVNDEYVYRIPNPKHRNKYTKVKVLRTQDKHTQLSSFTQLCCYAIKSIADAGPPDYVDTHSLPTGYLRP